MEGDNFRLCRLCRKSSNFCTNIFYPVIPDGTNGLPIRKIIEELLQFEVREGDGLPATICPDCLTKLSEFQHFKTMCVDSRLEFLKVIDNKVVWIKTEVCDSENESNGNPRAEDEDGITIEKKTWERESLGSRRRKGSDSSFEKDLDIEEQYKHHPADTDKGKNLHFPAANEGRILKGQVEVRRLVGENHEILQEVIQPPIRDKNMEPMEISTHKLICDECGEIFLGKNALKTHVLYHKTLYQSAVADKQKKRQNDSGLPKGTEKTVACEVCDQVCSSLIELEKHYRAHTGVKTFVCSECGKYFIRKSDMMKHFRAHSGEKPFKCKVCNKQFSQSSNVNVHMRTHTGQRPFHCFVCEKSFCTSSSLNRHMRIHSGQKTYQCNICDKKFSDSSNLNKHMKIHAAKNKMHTQR